MKGYILNILCLIISVVTVVKGQEEKELKYRLSEKSLIDSTLLLVDLLFDIESRVTVHSGNKTVTREDVINKYKDQPISQGYNSIRNYTKHMAKDHYKKMMLYSFSDFGDIGDYDGGMRLSEFTEWNYMNVNLTKLPVDVRFGLGFPKECEQWMMDTAQDPLSSIASKMIQALGEIAGIEFFKEYDLGAGISFIQPRVWREKQLQQKSIGAIVVISFMTILAFLVVSLSILLNGWKSDKNSEHSKSINLSEEKERLLSEEGNHNTGVIPSDYNQTTRENTLATNATRDTTTIRPCYFGFSPKKQSAPICPLQTNPPRVTPLTESISTEPSADVFAKPPQNVPEIIKREKYNAPFLRNVVNGFSTQRNISSLHKPINKFVEDEDLAFIDGMRVLTMLWVILSLTAVFILISNCRDLQVIFTYFSGYPFAILAACFITPELFIFYIFFLGFIYMARFYDINRGIGLTDYIRFYIHRFLKLAPMYYLVFFFTWFVYPLIFSKPGWFVSERFSTNGDTEWPFVLTFLNNLMPFFTQALNGCYYWPYVVSNDMLLHIFFPLTVILYKKNRKMFYVFTVLLLIVGCIIDYLITVQNKLRVGILTFEDYYLFSLFYNKPYTKFPVLAGGMGMGAFYLQLIKYRKATEEEKKKEYRIIHYLHNSILIAVLLYLYAFGIINFINLVQVTSNRNGYSWKMDENGFFFAFSRFGYISGIMAVIVNILTGKGYYIKVLLSGYFWRPLSRLSYVAYLIFPLVIGASLFDTSYTLYANYARAALSMLSCIILTYVFSLFAYLLFEKPMENLKNYIKFLIFADESIKYSPRTQDLKVISEEISRKNFIKKDV